MGHEPQRLFEAKSLHEIGRGRSDEGLEHSVEMERRQHRDPRQFPKPKRFLEMADDVVDGKVDPLDVRRRSGRLRFLGGSQDLSSLSEFGR